MSRAEQKIFITGATGLVGSHLLAHCVIQKIDVVAYKRESSKDNVLKYVFGFYDLDYDKLSPDYITWKIGELDDEEKMTAAMSGCDTVIHCAADVGLGGVDEKNMIRVNVGFTRKVLDAAKKSGVKRFCYLSSIAALGNARVYGEYINEDTPWIDEEVHSVYAKTKRAAMSEVLDADNSVMSCVAVCPGPILGASCRDSGSSQIIYLAKRGVPFASKGGSGYVDVRDVCKALLLLSKNTTMANKYVLVSENVSNSELLKLLCNRFGKFKPMTLPTWFIYTAAYVAEFIWPLFGKKPQLDRSMARTITSRSYYSSERIKKELDFEFIPLSKTVEDISNYMK